VKNVAGYDMAKLHINAVGTLGVILHASFKVSPLPASQANVAARGSLESMSELAAAVLAARLPLYGLALARPAEGRDWMLAGRIGGGSAAVERAVVEFSGLAGAAGADGESSRRLAYPADDMAVRARATVPAKQLTQLCQALAAAGAAVTAYPGVGVAYGCWGTEPAAEALTGLRAAAVAAGGALVLERGSVGLKREVGVWGDPPASLALMQRLKQQFDPGRVLNPGRFVGGI
jgi:glycolate oxidase FAD binding subunit